MKKGFTLVELLAVIVILAIIASIATPIVLNVINSTKESSYIESANMYLDALEIYISEELKKNPINNGIHTVMEDGSLCFGYESEETVCDRILKVKVSGNIPEKGSYVTIKDSRVEKMNLIFEGKDVIMSSEGNNSENTIVVNKYKIGDEVKFNPGDGTKTWNVIDETQDTVTLLMSENLKNNVPWNNQGDYSLPGPLNAMTELNSLTSNWTNVESIKNYVYINNLNDDSTKYGYQKFEIINGNLTLISQSGQSKKITGETKARLLTSEELFEMCKKMNINFFEQNLRFYIERNINSINAALGTSFTTVDEVIDYSSTWTSSDKWHTNISFVRDEFKHYSRYLETYYTVYNYIKKYNIESTFDIEIPKFIYQNLNGTITGYWTLTTRTYSKWSAYRVRFDKVHIDICSTNETKNSGIRPVITISKSKLK